MASDTKRHIFQIHFNFYKTNIVNYTNQEGQITNKRTTGFDLGFDLIKGLWITIFYGSGFISTSKDAIHYYVKNKYNNFYAIFYIFLIRILAFFDIIFFLLVLPFSILVYTLVIIYSFFLLIIFTIFYFFKDSFIEKAKYAGTYFICSWGSLFFIFMNILLIPIHLFVPEFTVLVYKIQNYGYKLDYCYQ